MYKAFLFLTLLFNSIIEASPQESDSIVLDSLDGTSGYVFHGSNVSDYTGWAVDGIGDVNGDGVDDVAIGADGADISGNRAGAVYVVYGTEDMFASPLNADFLIQNNRGFVIRGRENSAFGWDVSGVGDINEDGFDDFFIGSFFPASSSFLIFGQPNFQNEINVDSLGDGGVEFVKNDGPDANLLRVRAVAEIGDVNGDGREDFGILDNAAPDNPGRAYVIFGNPKISGPLFQLDSLNGQNGFLISGINFVFDLDGADDFNGDGVQDLIVGYSNSDNEQRVGIIFGRDNENFPAELDLTGLDGTNGFTINEVGSDTTFGDNVAGVQDFNNDGMSDVAISNSSASTVYLIYGKSENIIGEYILSDIYDAFGGFAIESSNSDINTLGYTLSRAGDFNGDQISDLMIGTRGYDSSDEKTYDWVYLIYGGMELPSIKNNVFYIQDLFSGHGIVFKSIIENSTLFHSTVAINPAGDINNDQVADVIIGRQAGNFNGDASGSAYVVFGKNDLIFKNTFGDNSPK